METREWRFEDKTSWPRGPWDDEPDKKQWTDMATGYPCLIRRGPSGALCGYVGLPEGHVFYRLDYDDVDISYDGPHGGLTYADFCQPDHEHGICHVPDPDEPDNVWWLGFDCAHYMDLSPAFDQPLRDQRVYRNIAYVTRERERLAAELASFGGKKP